jgi:hypothetical protein
VIGMILDRRYCSICISRGRESERREAALISSYSSLPLKCPRRESGFPHS